MTAKPLTAAEVAACPMPTESPVQPHPDGKPWDKCCGTKRDGHIGFIGSPVPGCTCLMRKPAGAPGSRYDYILEKVSHSMVPVTLSVKQDLQILEQESGRFFCIHRKTDDGFHRECAGWAAKFKHR